MARISIRDDGLEGRLQADTSFLSLVLEKAVEPKYRSTVVAVGVFQGVLLMHEIRYCYTMSTCLKCHEEAATKSAENNVARKDAFCRMKSLRKIPC